MACDNPKCKCTICINPECSCDGAKECFCKPEDKSCCCNK